MSATDFSLYLITDRHQTGGRPLTDVVRLALLGGVRCVQIREKDLSGAGQFRLALELRDITRQFGARLIINDRPDIALAVAADGVHLGINSLPVAEVRRILGSKMLIGYSAHDIAEARLAEADGADFLTFGPLYFTPSKSPFGEPCGVNKMTEVSQEMKIPVFALGGISRDNIDEVLNTKVAGIAVISAIISADDPRGAAVFMLKKIEEHVKHP